ncbi:uncharacterized protein BHQ10_009364 [Talaromyces amestolkiae]|uniref:Rhodopsin domain-containing protein n=1 Tax=Talaromyces amestolkiae TaxID=1196081 RepID=A0A364LC30_TALAM|nr:uncharacterized protein BHQ10_009364 [Talaromyces amestolkiae]RAO73352.1 hypothetical protein BHQ10_009364 [Talaromyces amestolkiae]
MLNTLQPAALGISTVFWTLSTATIVLRLWSRLFIIKSFGWDDALMSAILVFNIGQQGLFYTFVHFGGGLHYGSVPLAHLALLPKLLFVEEIYYIWMHFIIKMSFLLFYLRLSNTWRFTLSIYGAMGIVMASTIAIWLIYCLQCIPLPAFWDPTAYPGAKCLSTKITYYVVVALCIFGDLLILILPIQPLWHMQASLRRRLTLIGVITFGGMSPLVSFLRIIVLHEFEVSPDFTWTLGKMVIVSAIELDVAIIASNAASMKAIWVKYLGKNPFSSTGDQGPSSYPKQKSNELVNLPYNSRAKRSGHTHVASIDGNGSRGRKELWENDSEEELFQGNGITVTSSVDMISKKSAVASAADVNRSYFEFKK